MQSLSEFIRVGRRFQKAIRVDVDNADGGALDGYVFSPSAAQILKQMAAQVAETGQGAFTWTGPYGGGKSSLALLLAALLGQDAKKKKVARALVGASAAAQIAKHLGAGGNGRIVVPVIGRRADADVAIIEAVAQHAPSGKRRRGKTAIDILRCLAEEPAGVLLVIDEMGKFLEHAARGGEGDVHFFQQLAEEASRSKGRLLVVGILHQAFDDYANKLAREMRNEWAKVQGRFADIPLNIAAEEQVELISRAMEVPDDKRPDAKQATAFALVTKRPRGEDLDGFADRLHKCWPLSPAVACLLGPISRRRFGQSQRSIFGFLNSGEPFGFQSFLRETTDGGAAFDLPRLWDYLRANLEPSILASPDGHRWSLAVEALERCEVRGGDAEHVAVVKSIALIDLFKERSGLSASQALLEASLPSLKPKRMSGVLKALTDWSIVIFKKHLGAYAIYAGSDFDIEDAVLEARAKMTGLDFGRLRSVAMLQPILAKRFYHQTGSLLWFDVDIAPLSSAVETIRNYKPANGSTGLFLLLIGTEAEDDSKAKRIVRAAAEVECGYPFAIGCSRDNFLIREAAFELLALETVRAGRSELNGDSVARREVGARIARAVAELEDRLHEAFASAQWKSNVEGVDARVANLRAGAACLNIMASQLAGAWFRMSPVIHNELLNRIKPSSNATAAQKALLRAMVEHPREEKLGIEGYPAEGGLYAALIERPGLHRRDPDDPAAFRFLPPPSDDESRLANLWKVAEDMVHGATGAQVSMSDIFSKWKAAPYGVRDGLLPVLGIAFIMSRLEHLSIYLDGVYQVRMTTMVVDRLMQDWDAVRLRWSKLSELQRSALSSLADVVAANGGFDLEPACRAPTPLDIAKGLVRLVNELPPWVLRTATLPSGATQVRNLGKTANDPNKFLLDDLPSVIGDETDRGDPSKLAAFVGEGVAALLAAYPTLMGDLEAVMLKELRVKAAKPETVADLRNRAETVRGLTGNYRLDAFATRLMTYDLAKDKVEPIEGIVALAANKPTRDWLDRDVDYARIELATLAQEFVKAEGFAHVKGRKDHRLSLAIYSSDPRKDAPVRAEADITTEENLEVAALAAEILALLEGKGISRDAKLGVIAEVGAKLAAPSDFARPVKAKKRKIA
ncbi:MAG: ATP-binding protein [Methylocystis sp.]